MNSIYLEPLINLINSNLFLDDDFKEELYKDYKNFNNLLIGLEYTSSFSHPVSDFFNINLKLI